MEKLTIIHKTYDGDCDDCGMYQDESLVVRREDGSTVVDLFMDGHLGNGDTDLNNPIEVLQKVLVALGYSVTLEEVES